MSGSHGNHDPLTASHVALNSFQLATFYMNLFWPATVNLYTLLRRESAHSIFCGCSPRDPALFQFTDLQVTCLPVLRPSHNHSSALSPAILTMGVWPRWKGLRVTGDHTSPQQKRQEASSCSPIGQTTSGFFHHRGFQNCKPNF